MAEVILMPRLSDTMTEGVIGIWKKEVGDKVEKGDIIAEIETDKATMELESYKQGTLLYIGTPSGGKLKVNDLLAIIGNPGEDISEWIKPVFIETTTPATQQKETVLAEEKIATPNAVINEDEVVLMPRLSDTMTEGVIAGWNKQVGNKVEKGEVLAEIETDKATMELESYKTGILLYQGAAVGEKIKVNDLLAIIAEQEKDISSIVGKYKSTSNQTTPTESKTIDTATTATTTEQATLADQPISTEEKGRIFASPLAKKIAADQGVDLSLIKGTGDNGRITKIDVENFKPLPKEAILTPATSASKTITTNYEDIPLSQMRKVIARRLSESMFTAPHFYLTMKINMDAAINARQIFNEQGSATKISFNDIIIKATALALEKHPAVNSSWLGEAIRYNKNINIGVAVAVEEGLLVPVIKNTNQLSLQNISQAVKFLAQKAKDKKLQPADWEGNTFTISNLGMFGIEAFTAIINPPDACILAVGGIAQEPIVKNGQMVVGNIMHLTLSCDHRVVDGAVGAAFLQTLKGFLEEPLKMLL